ncbi:MAG: short-chain dehydrogenase [Acidobacteria bacterium]|nr:MAG: short-chain dehydrogenase [Acidobacteriota bacterium]
MKWLLILGATSDIAKACAHRFAAEGFSLVLAARKPGELDRDVKDLQIRYDIDVKTVPFDVLDMEQHREFFQSLNPMPDGVLCAIGTMAENEAAISDPKKLKPIIDTNFTGPSLILTLAAEAFRKRGSGFIIGISSVAGNRGRGTNYPYGSAKAGFTAFLSGLRDRLNQSNVRVITVLPGFVRTKMTEDMDLPAKLTAEPDKVAADIFKGWKKGTSVIYTKGIWWLIMLVIQHIPEFIFKRMKL